MTKSTPELDWRAAHGAVFVLLMACCSPAPALRGWPWVWLAPFLAYFALVACVPPLRGSMTWLSAGKLSAGSAAIALGLMALSVLALVLFQTAVHPDLRGLR